ncbi:ribonuclease E inhibitor RraB [Amycolatopsis sp. NPDC051372]|uniref:ribonuclease E inhibitor RraB n=1 Tax=Amycolatopsis sp. NPDC051372 TaxID=3155669 RepID=UPI003436C869
MSLLGRLRDLARKRESPALTPDAPGLVIVAEAFDPAVADSAVLTNSPGWVASAPAVFVHHLSLPPERVAEAAAILAQDGWELREQGPDGDRVLVHALRVQVLDALHCAQERSRMAGLAQRLGGDALGWDARQPGESPTASA